MGHSRNIQKTVNSSSALLVPALILSVPGACCSSWSNLGTDHGQVPPQSSPVGLEMQKSEATKQPPLHMLDLVRFVTRLKGKRDKFNAAPEDAAPIWNSTSEHQPGGWPRGDSWGSWVPGLLPRAQLLAWSTGIHQTGLRPEPNGSCP